MTVGSPIAAEMQDLLCAGLQKSLQLVPVQQQQGVSAVAHPAPARKQVEIQSTVSDSLLKNIRQS